VLPPLNPLLLSSRSEGRSPTLLLGAKHFRISHNRRSGRVAICSFALRSFIATIREPAPPFALVGAGHDGTCPVRSLRSGIRSIASVAQPSAWSSQRQLTIRTFAPRLPWHIYMTRNRTQVSSMLQQVFEWEFNLEEMAALGAFLASLNDVSGPTRCFRPRIRENCFRVSVGVIGSNRRRSKQPEAPFRLNGGPNERRQYDAMNPRACRPLTTSRR